MALTASGKRRALIAGTRASALAVAQAEEVIARLREMEPAPEVITRYVSTGGDRDGQTPLTELGGQGIFVKEIESALLSGWIDLAVHSLKDMPTVQPEGLAIAAVLPREDPRDALVSRLGLTLEKLPTGARVGTGSLRRQAQLRAYRPDLEVIGLRGNVDTRLRKAASGDYDAIVLALAGLVRLGRADEATAIIPLDIMLPAVGQGAVCVEARADDAEVLALMAALDDPATHAATAAERSFLRELGGGCHVPIAAFGSISGAELHLHGLVAGATGERVVRESVSGRPDQAEELGRRLAGELLRQGCAELLTEEAYRA